MLEPVVVRKLKFGGRIRSEWEGELIEVVGHSWAIVHHDPDVHEKVQDGTSARQPNHHFHVLGLDVPLTALLSYTDAGEFIEAKLDVAEPGRRRRAVFEFVDLDLDVIVERSGEYWTRDIETFAANREALGYTPEVERTAHEGMGLALRIARTGAYPLGRPLEHVLAECLGRSRERVLAPLDDGAPG